MFCTNCGSQNDDGAKFCKSCGVQLIQSDLPVNRSQAAPQSLNQSQQPQTAPQSQNESQQPQTAPQSPNQSQQPQTAPQSQNQSQQPQNQSQQPQTAPQSQNQSQQKANNLQPNGAPMNQVPVQPPKKKSKTGLIIALAVVGVLAVAGVATAGYFVVKSAISESSEAEEDDAKSKKDSDVNKADKDTDNNDSKSKKEEAAKKAAEEKAAAEEQARAKKEAELKELNTKAHRAYGDIIMAYQSGSKEDSGMKNYDFDNEYGSDYVSRGTDKYDIIDIDSDGLDELLLFSDNTYTANMQLNIFYYDKQSEKAVCIDDTLSPFITLYDNGVIKSESLHNQTASEFWPYYLCKYDSDSKSFIELGSVSGWDKQFSATDYDGADFPDDIDVDGNGCVYSIYSKGESKYVDDSDYQKWFEEQLDGGTEVTLNSSEVQDQYKDSRLTADYKEYLINNINELCGDNNDLGLAFVKSSFVETGMDFMAMTQSFVTYEPADEYGMSYNGTINGCAAVEYFAEDGGDLSYIQAADGVTLFGIKPGDKVDDAKKKLESIGFYELEDSSSDDIVLINGIHTVSFAIRFEQNNNVITKVCMGCYSRFVS